MEIKSNFIQFQNTFTQNIESKANDKSNSAWPVEFAPKDSIQLSKNTNKSENNATYAQYSSQKSVSPNASKIADNTSETTLSEIKSGLIHTDDGKIILKGTNGDNIRINLVENSDKDSKEKNYAIHYNEEKYTLTEQEISDNFVIELGTGNTLLVEKDLWIDKLPIRVQGDNNTINSAENSVLEMTGNNNSVSIARGLNDITIKGSNNNLRVDSSFFATNEIKVYGKSNTIHGSNARDTITVKGNHNRIHGHGGDDSLNIKGDNNRIYGGEGNDTILVDGNKNRIHGGMDNDIIKAEGDKNVVFGGQGNDYIEAGGGHNFIYGGIRGDNVIYSTGDYKVAGVNELHGGKGNNYIDAGEGNGIIFGGTGKNIIASKNKNNQIENVGENDVLIGEWKLAGNTELPESVKQYPKSSSSDYTIKKFLKNNIFFSTTLNDKGSVSILDKHEGLDFKRRVMSDLKTLKYIPEGRALLEELAKTKYPLFFAQNNYDYKNCSATAGGDMIFSNLDGTPNKGNFSLIQYNPSFSLANKDLSESDLPPVGNLVHEMVHSYNHMTGTMISSEEKISFDDGVSVLLTEHQAVGIPISADETQQQPITYPDGTKSLNNPEGLSENAFRNALGLELRHHYYNPNKV